MTSFNFEQFETTPEELLIGLAEKVRKRRLEKGLSRATLQSFTGVPAPTIAHFENCAKISLEAFIRIAAALGYNEEIKSLLQEPKYSTMDEMETIKKNRNRKRGQR